MPTSIASVDHAPLFTEFELTINDEDVLAQQIAQLMLGHHLHVENILRAKKGITTYSPNSVIDVALKRLVVKDEYERYKRDGWIFQLITWIVINKENSKYPFKCQIPHPAPAMHGIDGLGVVLSAKNEIVKIIISEDKYTENPRRTLKKEVWKEFELFELRTYDSQLVGIVTGLLKDLSVKEINEAIYRDIYNIELRTYRVGITPKKGHYHKNGKKRLFKGYDNCVKGPAHSRREGLTFRQSDIRSWMDSISLKIAAHLTSNKT